MNWLSEIAEVVEIPFLAAFALGVLTAVSPCPLATNITATAFISKELSDRRMVLLNGLLYTIGRGVSYTAIGLVLFFGASKFHVARFFQSNGEAYLTPILIVVGLIMLGIIRIDFFSKINITGRLAERSQKKSSFSDFALGVLFALAFCPYSGALYFGMLIPMTIAEPSGLYLPLIFAFGTGLPVMFFAYLLAFSASKIGAAFNTIQKAEKVMRYGAGAIFILTGLYYGLIFLGWL